MFDKTMARGIPHGVPDWFLEVFFKWQEDTAALRRAYYVINAAKKLSFDELMDLLRQRDMPGMNSEMYIFAVLELSTRHLTLEQISAVRQEWCRVKLIVEQWPFPIMLGLHERRQLKVLIG